MDYYPNHKKPRHLDFSRPTFNEPNIEVPENPERNS